MAKKQISLYIDDAAIHVMVCRGREPLKWYSSSLQPGIIKDGTIKDQEAAVLALKEIWQSQKIGSKKVAVAISGVNCLYQLMVLPELPDDLLAEAISREASQTLGIVLTEVYLSWQVLSIERGQMRIYLTAIPRETIDSIMAAAHRAGLRPYLMDIKPLCLARAASESRAVIVDLQPGSFDVVVLGEGIPEVVRSLSLPDDISVNERNALIKSEMDRAIMFYNSAHMDKPIDLNVPIMVSGELAYHESDWDALKGPRERLVQVLLSAVEERDGFPSARFATNIGMALKEILSEEEGAVTYSLVNFNALPEAYLPRKRSLADTLLLPVIVVGIILVGLGFWGYFYLSGQNATLEDDLEAVQSRIEQQQVRQTDLDALKKQVDGVNALAANLDGMLAGLDGSRTILADDLSQIFASLPGGVSLNSVSTAADGIAASGVAAGGEPEVRSYAWSLKDGGRFSSVIVTNLTTTEEGAVAFSLLLIR